MKIKELLRGQPVLECTADLESEISALCYDSRRAEPGCAFVAIQGFKSDGHGYIGAAEKQGAALCVCQRRPEEDIPYILVEDSRKALAVLSGNFFGNPQSKMEIIGVTGTNGKTTVTNIVKSMLEQWGHKCGLIGTNGNMIGDAFLPTERTTPESYELYSLMADMLAAGCRYVVMEVSSHSVSLDRIWGLEFNTAVFTNLTQDHLDFHGTMEAYAAAKAVLFSRCRNAVINIDDPYSACMLDSAKATGAFVLTYSAKNDAGNLVAKNIKLLPGSVQFEGVTEGFINRVTLGIPGMFSVYNALAAVGCCLTLGMELAVAARFIAQCKGVKGRAQVVPAAAPYTVIIDYAHTPDGVENILKAARGFAKGRVVALFGCGGDRDKTKRPLMGAAAGGLADFCIVTSDNPRSENPMDIINDVLPGVKKSKCSYAVIPDRREAIVYALDHGLEGDVIVLMGKGHEDYQEINGKKLHLDENEEVGKYFAGRQ